ncbi:hypothetical protein E7744_02385 [Citricoccus sp. SGAir0253]|uniref:serine hydrolase n=1 Tax=Citricoccus sp. SGAir0253 TaxID=2567881 RepID=UPI0010CCC44C|nr:serine hydrolase [Citricoccus sp. SGAir0253]QCU77192.1 hypothetical protein E7744_02385 [Citricoccus sp. SGAir0253]
MSAPSPARPAPPALGTPLADVPTAAPGLRFAVRFPGAPASGEEAGAAASRPGAAAEEVRPGPAREAVRPGLASEAVRLGPRDHEADRPHALAGTGKLVLALAVARLADDEPGLLAQPVEIGARHRAGARAGTLRLMGGDLSLAVGDAMALVVGTGDGACVLALLEALAARGVDVLAEARRAVADVGLAATELTGLEAGESWGEGLLGTTTPADLCALLERLVAAGMPVAHGGAPAGPPRVAHRLAAMGEAAGAPGGPASPSPPVANPAPATEEGSGAPGGPAPLPAPVADRVLGWMGTAFEPAGLASALPGFGPRTLPHRTVSGWELLAPPGAPGCASVLVLPAGVGTGSPAACVAAYHPGARADGSAVPPRERSRTLGALGLAVAAARGDASRLG